ncbi:hypothetical protein FHG87_007720 [Trinorchestia longiramus]|nr:hypothetical protein FHG87_007720 [Trinorchestia longiramus]
MEESADNTIDLITLSCDRVTSDNTTDSVTYNTGVTRHTHTKQTTELQATPTKLKNESAEQLQAMMKGGAVTETPAAATSAAAATSTAATSTAATSTAATSTAATSAAATSTAATTAAATSTAATSAVATSVVTLTATLTASTAPPIKETRTATISTATSSKRARTEATSAAGNEMTLSCSKQHNVTLQLCMQRSRTQQFMASSFTAGESQQRRPTRKFSPYQERKKMPERSNQHTDALLSNAG